MFRKYLISLIFIFTLNITMSNTLTAQTANIPSAPIIGAKSYLVIDTLTNHEIASLEPNLRLPPASITKLMTAYVTFHALESDQISLEDQVTISEKAWRMTGSRMFIEVGKKVSVQDLLMGMIVQSGNDASVALAEFVAGSEFLFVDLMNQYAANLSMTSSSFQNSTGLPDENHFSTAHDLSLLAKAIITEFPKYYKWYSTKEFTYNEITQRNRNSLLWRDPSVDGMKTGSTEEAGYCLVSSAIRNDMRLISVVLGTATAKSRNDGSQALLNYGFRFHETKTIFMSEKEIIAVKTWKTQSETLSLGILNDLNLTLPRGSFSKLSIENNIQPEIIGPIDKGQVLGELVIKLNDSTLATQALVALENNPKGTLWQQIKDTMQLWFE
jgi:D-alanyl-D-alanine carboxypeptidase (penicillin-binding protein 5/6)|tara:strand:+ start:9636 stop:10787 length:1152 start_codon:yes stop_codon:yes gene_type:complete